MTVPFRLAALGVTVEEIEAIREVAWNKGRRIEVYWLQRPEELSELRPGKMDAVAIGHEPPELDAMLWLPRFRRPESPPMIVLSQVKDDREADRLRRAGALAVVGIGSEAGLRRAVRRVIDRSTILTSESDLRKLAGLVGVIGNSLRDEMGGIRNAIEVLTFQCSGEGALSQQRAIEYLDRQCRRMEALLDDYSEVSRLGSGAIEPGRGLAELGASLDRAIERARVEVGGDTFIASREPRPELLWLRIEPRRLEQLVRHGLNSVRGSLHGCAEVRVDYRVGLDWIDLIIRPLGAGGHAEPPSERQAVDLFLASTLAERLGGRVRSGSPLLIQLPRSLENRVREPEDDEDLGTDPGGVPSSSKRPLLMIDDHPATVEVLGMLIGRRGWDVRVTPDIFEAIEMIRTFRPEVVLIDLHMPIMNGDALARLIRSDHAAVRPLLIGISGSMELSEQEEEDIRSCFDHFLFKPVRSEQVAALLPPPKERAVGGHRSPGAQNRPPSFGA